MTSPDIPSQDPPEYAQAVLEYFADLALDDRIDFLKAKSDYVKTSFSTLTKSNYEVYPPLLSYNRLAPYTDEDGDIEKTFPFTMLDVSGSFARFHGVRHANLELVSHNDNSTEQLVLRAQDNGNFQLSTSSPHDIKQLVPYEVARLSFVANNTDPDPYLVDLPTGREGMYEAHKIIEKVWDYSTQIAGFQTTEHLIERESPSSSEDTPVFHRFLYREDRYARDSDTISMIYEKIIKTPILDTEAIYRLSTTLVSTEDSQSQEAARIIQSMQFTVKSIDFTYIPTNGAYEKLDINNPTIMKEFVDSFDELLSLAN